MTSDLRKIEIDSIYEEILYTFLHNDNLEIDNNFEVTSLFDYIQNAFTVDENFHKRMLKLANHRNPSILRIDVKCTEAKYLRTKSVTGTGNYMVNIFKTSSPDHVSSTQIQFDTNNPNWTDLISIPIVKSIDNERIMFEVFDCGDCSDETDPKKGDTSSESGSIRGLKSLIKELTQTGNKSKKLVGRAAVPLDSIKIEGLNVWLNLEKNGKYNNRGKINVEISYCVEKSRDVSLEQYQCLVYNLLLYELQVSRVADYWWDGKFSELGEAVLRAYLSRIHLTKFDVAISKWAVFSKVHVKHPLSFLLFDSLLNKFLKSLDDSVSDTDMKYIWDGAARILPSCLTHIHDQIANNTCDSTLNIILNILKKLQDLIDRTPESNSRNCVFNFSIYEAVENAVTDGANDWFDKQLEEQNISMITDSENITKLNNLTYMLQTNLSQAMKLDEIFVVINNLRFAETLFLVYDEKLSYILENILNATDSDWQILYCAADQPDIIHEAQEKNITTALFQLYLTLKELLALSTKIIVESDNETFKLTRCQNWFSGALTHWLELGVEKALTTIEVAVKKDKFIPEYEGAKYSSSAIDTLEIFYQVKYIWEQLEWTDDLGSFMIIGKIIYDICRLCAFYANQIQSALENLHLNHNHTQANFEVTQQWCLAINNIEFIRGNINTFINEISIESMVNRISNTYNSFEAERATETFENIMEYINDIKNYTILNSINQVIRHISLTIRSNLETVTKSQNFKSKSISDLFEYIDESMLTLRTELNTINLERTVELLWDEVINILEETITMAAQNRNRPEFYSNLRHFFYNVVYIVTTVEPSNEHFMRDCPSLLYIDNLIRLNALETPHLIHQYHLVRARSQNVMFEVKNATLTIRCHLNENDLFIEILNARYLETVLGSHSTKCNPFVKVHLLTLDQHKIEHTTKMHKNNTIPLIDENVTIKLQPIDLTCDRTLIIFTVWNRSIVFKTEEFLGECYVAIQDVPNGFVEQQIHLNLSKSSDVTKTVLNILEKRQRYDKEAQVFLSSILKRNKLYPKCCIF